MKLSNSDLLKQLQPLIKLFRKYRAFLFVITFLGVYVYQAYYIGQLIQNEPTGTAVNENLKPVGKLKVDQDTIRSISELESQNVQVKSLFESARQNPFTE